MALGITHGLLARRTQGGRYVYGLDLIMGAWVLLYQKSKGPLMDSAITSKGQATIPKAIREHLGLQPGGRVKFFVHPDGSVVLLPVRPVSALRGIVKPRQPPATVEDMTEAAAAGATADATVRTRQ
jgi:AbrB family looped-hinge helix DNA binding protein